MDYSAFPVQVSVYLGDTGPLDVTRNVESYTPINTSALDLPRIVKVETSITLVGDRAFLETRNNLRWTKGNKVEIKVRNSQGTFVLHRTLRILDNFFNDNPKKPTLELKLGCLFALKESRYPNPGDLKIPILENRPDVLITTTINYWLRTFGLPEITSLPGDYVPSDRIYTTGLYSGGSSITEHIGKIALNSDFVLWVDAQERVRVRQINLAPTTINVEVSPRDLAVYSRATGERERVAGTVRVLGVANYKFPYVDPPAQTTSTSQGDFQTSETVAVSTTATSRTVTKRGTAVIGTEDTGKIGQYVEVTTESYSGGFLEQANPNPVLPPIPGLPPWLDTVSYTLQEQRLGADGKLTALQTTKTRTETYGYRTTSARQQGLTVRGVEVQNVTEKTQILPEGETTLKTDQVKTTNWVYLSPEIYVCTTSIIRPEDTENRRYSQVSTSVGESTPPATTFAPRTVVTQQIEIYGEARFSYPPDAPDNDHPRDYNVGAYIDTSPRAKKLAQQLGALLIGRNEAQNIGLRPPDAWLSNPAPLQIVAVAHNNLEQDLYLLDVPVLLLGKRSYLGGSGIWLGRRAIATGAITPPYAIKQKVIGYGTKLIGYGIKVFEAGT